jgi:hypothetical protein
VAHGDRGQLVLDGDRQDGTRRVARVAQEERLRGVIAASTAAGSSAKSSSKRVAT